MENSFVLAVIALLLNVITLGIVIYQTVLNRKSLEAANESIKLTKTSRQLEILPRAYFVIEVQIRIEYWQENLTKMIKWLKSGKPEDIKQLNGLAPKTPEGMVEKYLYDKMPDWLAEIWMTGAQYYYDSTASLRLIKDGNNNEIYIQNCQDSLVRLKQLLTYIKDEIPDVFLQRPASIRDRDFLKE
jgi:hypothetical protein